MTTWNLQARHNSSSWKDVIVVTSNGQIALGHNNPAYPFHQKALANQRSRFEFGTTQIDVVDYGASAFEYAGSGGIFVNGSDALFMSGPGRSIRLVTYDGTYRERLRISPNGKVGINTTSPNHQLSVNGTIGAKEINVATTGWADYVFSSTYQLMSLSELEYLIKEKGHLPGIPTEKEVVKNGVNLLEMNIKLLEKVENLTLYIIDQERRIKDLEEKKQL